LVTLGSSVFENFPLYSNCKIFFFMAINMRRLTATSEIYFYSKYKKNEPKMMSKHIEKLLMLPIYNLVKSADFLKPYRSPLAIQSFEFNKTYKSKSIFCGTSLYYTVMPTRTLLWNNSVLAILSSCDSIKTTKQVCRKMRIVS
jgi:hypothetical protein